MNEGRRWLRAAVLLAALLAMPALAAPRIALVTMQPGEAYWSRFGHNAILVDDPGRGTRTLYNYGWFDFDQPGFIPRFLLGKMRYRLVALPASEDLPHYRQEGRGVALQWLDLDPDSAIGLAGFLEWNARPENAEYRYDYFTDNCSTRVRDALDEALGGRLKQALVPRSRGLSYRSESRRLAAPQWWLYLGIDLGMGPFVDVPLSRWQEGFVPMRLSEAVREVRLADGRPLVAAELEVFPHRLAPVGDEPPQWLWRFLAAGLLLAAAIAQSARARAGVAARRLAAGVAAMLWLVCGIVGLGLAALWAFTDHTAAWANANLLLFDPLCLALLPAIAPLLRGNAAPAWLRRLALAVAAIATAALLLQALPFRGQVHGDWIALMLPVHVATAWRLRHGTRA